MTKTKTVEELSGEEQAMERFFDTAREGFEDDNISMILVTANSEEGTVKICGWNIDEMEVPLLLTETATQIGQRVLDQIQGRTLQ